MSPINIFWFRRDLRLHDNIALFHALKSGTPVVPFFIFDTAILDQLEDKKDARVHFIHQCISDIRAALSEGGIGIEVLTGRPEEIFKELIKKYPVNAVYTNHDYELYARNRDEEISSLLKQHNISFHTFKDQVIFEKDEVVKDDGKSYSVFTPYSRKWKALLSDNDLASKPSEDFTDNFHRQAPLKMPSLSEIGFLPSSVDIPSREPSAALIRSYAATRNTPSVSGTSKLGVHLRFGTISIRELARNTKDLSAVFLNELIWRDFYHMILWHHPWLGEGRSFKPQYDNIKWRNNESEFTQWCNGNTGYPIVDAGMRELNTTGFMHNRVRMIVASFLCKHLLIDWRWGEAYFASKLLDYDFAANNGGWQWASGSGCDSAPYFRIFNPYLQTKKFDPELKYVKKWVPEFQEFTYPPPIVEHEFARKRCLEVYSEGLNSERIL